MRHFIEIEVHTDSMPEAGIPTNCFSCPFSKGTGGGKLECQIMRGMLRDEERDRCRIDARESLKHTLNICPIVGYRVSK